VLSFSPKTAPGCAGCSAIQNQLLCARPDDRRGQLSSRVARIRAAAPTRPNVETLDLQPARAHRFRAVARGRLPDQSQSPRTADTPDSGMGSLRHTLRPRLSAVRSVAPSHSARGPAGERRPSALSSPRSLHGPDQFALETTVLALEVGHFVPSTSSMPPYSSISRRITLVSSTLVEDTARPLRERAPIARPRCTHPTRRPSGVGCRDQRNGAGASSDGQCTRGRLSGVMSLALCPLA
jgi:hypothetical protein